VIIDALTVACDPSTVDTDQPICESACCSVSRAPPTAPSACLAATCGSGPLSGKCTRSRLYAPGSQTTPPRRSHATTLALSPGCVTSAREGRRALASNGSAANAAIRPTATTPRLRRTTRFRQWNLLRSGITAKHLPLARFVLAPRIVGRARAKETCSLWDAAAAARVQDTVVALIAGRSVAGV